MRLAEHQSRALAFLSQRVGIDGGRIGVDLLNGQVFHAHPCDPCGGAPGPTDSCSECRGEGETYDTACDCEPCRDMRGEDWAPDGTARVFPNYSAAADGEPVEVPLKGAHVEQLTC